MYVHHVAFLILILTLGVFKSARSIYQDEYVNESHNYCSTKRDLLSCAKYRALTYIANYTDRSVISQLAGAVRLVKFEDPEEDAIVFDRARHYSGDFEITKFFKFLQRQMNYFLNRQGVAIHLPVGARFLEFDEDGSYKMADARGKKKINGDLLIQLVTLFKVFKIKVLVGVAVVGIFFIKKMLLLSAFFLPSVINSLKSTCKAAAVHPYHVDEHTDFDSGYGGASYVHAAYGGHEADKEVIPYQRRQRI